MARLLLLPCVLALGCSEYGFVSPGPSTSEAPDADSPSSPPDPSGDTDPPAPGRELDCERASKVVVHELGPFVVATDFDADGWALWVGAGNGFALDDIWRARLNLARERITHRDSPYHKLRWPRLLPDGNLVYVLVPPIGEAHDDLQRIGMWDRNLNREVALTGGVQVIRAIEPDVDGTVYALHYGEPQVDGTPQAEVRWYDLYTGAERTVIRFDQPVYMLHNIALSAAGDVLYVPSSYIAEKTGAVYAIQRYGYWEWGTPTKIWSGGLVHGVAVDACDNLYIFEENRLLVLEKGADQPVHIADLPGPVHHPIWGSGVGDWASDVLFGYWHVPPGNDHGFIAIELDVDGTHILTR